MKNENTKLKAQLTEQVQELSDLKSINMNYKKSARVLDNDLAKTREKARLELTESKKILKKEIKYCRKELGEERKLKIQLENKLKESNELVKLHLSSIAVPTFQTGGSSPEQDSVELSLSQDNKSATFPQEQITCVICTEPVSNYVPKYVLGEEINPACQNCKASSTESETQQEDKIDETSDAVVVIPREPTQTNKEDKIREKMRISIKKKLETRFQEGQISKQEKEELEEELVTEMDEEIAKEILIRN